MVETQTIAIAILVLLGGYFLISSGTLDDLFVTVGITSPQIQFTNEPILVKLGVTNITGNVSIFSTHKSKEVEPEITISGDTYFLEYNITEPGLLKIFVDDDTGQRVVPVEIKKPHIVIENTIPVESEKTKVKSKIFTKNPQGEPINVDSITVNVVDPDSKKETIEPKKIGLGTYEFEIEYKKSGNYIFKIFPIKENFNSLDYSAITAILGFSRVPIILWVLIGGVALWLILFIIRRIQLRR